MSVSLGLKPKPFMIIESFEICIKLNFNGYWLVEDEDALLLLQSEATSLGISKWYRVGLVWLVNKLVWW